MTNEKENQFICENCQRQILNPPLGTANRNHCPFCLWSKHVDKIEAGDRTSKCQKLMMPIGLTFKDEGFDKYGKLRQGELTLIHQCQSCGKISINRIAGDDDEKMILKVFEDSQKFSPESLEKLASQNIQILKSSQKNQVLSQLLGNNENGLR